MNGLPGDFDYTVFVGKSLALVSFSENTIHLVFGEDVTVTIESAYSLGQNSDDESIEDRAVPVKESRLMGLVGRTVVDASTANGRDLSLEFDDGVVLRCLDNSDTFESYRIAFGDAEFFV